MGAAVAVGGAAITNVQIGIIAISLAMMAGLAWLVYRTRLGVAMRATSQNPQIAGLMGVDVNRIIASTFVIGAALAAVAGVPDERKSSFREAFGRAVRSWF